MIKFDTKAYCKIFLILMLSVSFPAFSKTSNPPVLNFSDLISGPDTGIGDGLGSGAIVTVWGQHLGIIQGDATITYTDSTNTTRAAAHIYYWKNADGKAPSGPANLYESHNMQEIAFSIPDSAQGAGTITVTTDTGSSSLPFTVREGSIFHTKPTGDDSEGDGSFGSPWKTVGKADSSTPSGSTLYIHDVVTGSLTTDLAIYTNTASMSSSLEAQYAYVAYPNTRPESIGYRGFGNYVSNGSMEGIVISKYSIFSAEADEDENGQPINVRSNQTYAMIGTKNGRAIGNKITDTHPSDTNGACPDGQNGAILANALSGDRISNFKVIGNFIHDYGCTGTAKFHHTTYFSIRSGENNLQLVSPEVAYNHLKDNKTRNGIHFYDENNSGLECGSYTTDTKIHHNVVVNQGGAGINIGANCPWTNDFRVYNNVVINSGKANSWDGVDTATVTGKTTSAMNITDGGLSGTIYIHNNTFSGWDEDDTPFDTHACIGIQGKSDTVSIIANDNICETEKDKPFFGIGCCGGEDTMPDNITGSGNLFFYSGSGTPTNAKIPSWDSTPLSTDPLLTITGSKVAVSSDSPVENMSQTTLEYNIYGSKRGAKSNVGAIEIINAPPKSPSNLSAHQ